MKKRRNRAKAKGLSLFLLFLSNPKGVLPKYIFMSMRPKQWVKNLFILLPLVFGKKLFLFPENAKAVLAILIFSVAAGVVYLINDIIDARKDKHHPMKRLRPIASGKVTLAEAKVSATGLGIVALTAAFGLSAQFGCIVLAYIALNLAYTAALKDKVIVDVACLSVCFLLRILAGAAVTGVAISHWIVIMTALLALFLGFNKRRQELRLLKRKAISHRRVLTQYSAYFIDQMIAVITTSIVVVYMLYTIDARTVREFGTSHLLYTIPFVYYGIFRYLYLIHKLNKDGDPSRILLTDKPMQMSVALWMLACVLVIYAGI